MQLVKLLHLLVPHFYLLEFTALRNHAKDLLVVHGLLESGIRYLNRVILYIVVTGSSAQIRSIQVARVLVKSEHVGFVELASRDLDQLLALYVQARVDL